MRASMSSGASRRSERAIHRWELLLVSGALSILVAIAAAWFFSRGYLLYYGDAQSHLNLSRSILDSRTPGYDQLGTVWLPALHLICLPFVINDRLWSSGLAGTIPIAACFVVSGSCFYHAARNVYRDRLAAAAVVACFAVNPNVLYLASIPMTEVLFLAAIGIFLVCFVEFRKTQKARYIAGAVAACWVMCLTRYDGWFLLPFAAAWFAFAAKRKRAFTFIAFSVAAGIAPLYWLAHNWFLTGNALDFFNGPYSAKAIQGNHPYPGLHNWALAILYYLSAGQLCTGVPLLLLGSAGLVYAWKQKLFAVPGFLCLTPLFYIWSLHSSGTPIFVPELYPHGYYNTRYGIAVLAVAAFATGAIVLRLPERSRRWAAVIPLLAIMPWVIHPSPEAWICWKESERNSVARRAWTEKAAAYFASHYVRGTGILTESGSGDLAAVFCRTAIPLRETLNIGNGPAWRAAISRPDLALAEAWAIALDGDHVSQALERPDATNKPVFEIKVPEASTVTIYSRQQVARTQP